MIVAAVKQLFRRFVENSSPPEKEFDELGNKWAAQILLTKTSRIVVPSREEWIGLNLLERDDELPPR